MKSSIGLVMKSIKRFPMHQMIRDSVNWSPLNYPKDGYSIIIGAMHNIPEIAVANLRMVANSDLSACHEVIMVFDCTAEQMPKGLQENIRAIGCVVPVRTLHYSIRQSKVSHKIDWGWVYAWMSWSIGISQCRTRHAILHDLDALPLDPSLFDVLYTRACQSSATFQAVRTYSGSGVTKNMGLGTTFELVMDAATVRSRFQAFDGFNKLRIINGSLVDFDTFLWIQHELPGSTHVLSIDENQLVHPSQLICNYTDFSSGRDALRTKQHSLLMMPYFGMLGGNSTDFERVADELQESNGSAVRMFGREMYLDHLKPEHWAWMEKQIRRTEQTLFTATRPEVERYLQSFVLNAGSSRSVGRETGGVVGV